eukprot:1891595-Heterocapsa_arctica.AAC.1
MGGVRASQGRGTREGVGRKDHSSQGGGGRTSGSAGSWVTMQSPHVEGRKGSQEVRIQIPLQEEGRRRG